MYLFFLQKKNLRNLSIALTLDEFLREKEKGDSRNSYSKLPGILVVVRLLYFGVT